MQRSKKRRVARVNDELLLDERFTLESLTIAQLKQQLKTRGISTRGLKLKIEYLCLLRPQLAKERSENKRSHPVTIENETKMIAPVNKRLLAACLVRYVADHLQIREVAFLAQTCAQYAAVLSLRLTGAVSEYLSLRRHLALQAGMNQERVLYQVGIRCRNLQTLSLTGCNITAAAMSNICTSNVASLRCVRLANCSYSTTIFRRLFCHCRNLQTLVLENTSIQDDWYTPKIFKSTGEDRVSLMLPTLETVEMRGSVCSWFFARDLWGAVPNIKCWTMIPYSPRDVDVYGFFLNRITQKPPSLLTFAVYRSPSLPKSCRKQICDLQQKCNAILSS